MKDTRGTPMVAKPLEVLDRMPPTAHRWASPRTPELRAILPDDSAVRPARPDPGRREDAQLPTAPAARGREALRPVRDAMRLANVIEAEVVPRLVLAGRAGIGGGAPEQESAPVGPEDVVALVGLVVADDATAAHAYVEALRVRGVALERLYLDLFAVTAQRLGQLWEEDLCSFADVTVGLVRLQGLVRDYSPAFLPPVETRDPRRCALLIPVPGEQHTFGLVMVAEFFQRAGWEVRCDPTISAEEVSRAVRGTWFAVVGISVGNNDRLETVAALVRRVRKESRNRGVGVMVGGRLFAEKPELANAVGADATATDGRQAALQAETLLALLATRN